MFLKKSKLDQSDINEFYYILPIENLESVLEKGILSHKRAGRLDVEQPSHADISDHDVQGRREGKEIPTVLQSRSHARELHQYVNLYMQPHNAMMFVKRKEAGHLCVLRIRKELLQRGDAVLTNRNAATQAAGFFKLTEWRPSVEESEALRGPYLKGTDNPRFLEKDEFDCRKKIRQSEALFPYEVPAEFISGIFVPNDEVLKKVAKVIKKSDRADIAITIHTTLFMQNDLQYYQQKLDPFLLPPALEVTRKKALSELPDPESSASEVDEEEQDATAFGF